jgi:hypothetical protein
VEAGVVLAPAVPDDDGYVSELVQLPAGSHHLELVVEDPLGAVGTDDVVVDVHPPNEPPTCAITEPIDGRAFHEGVSITFTGEVDDLETAPVDLAVEWSTSLGTAPFATSVPGANGEVSTVALLPPGAQVVTMVVEDEDGAFCTATRTLTVSSSPNLLVTDPPDNEIYPLEATIPFSATVSDGEDAPADLVVIWTSDRDGMLSSGPPDSNGLSSLARDDLSEGWHQLTVTVLDTTGLYAVDLRRFRNGLPPRPPTQPQISVIPPSPDTTDDLIARIDVDSVDPDGDAVSYRFEWFLEPMLTPELIGQVVPRSLTEKGQTWRLVVTPTDGRLEGSSAEVVVPIANAPPTLEGATLHPNDVRAGDTLSCSGTGFADADGDSPLWAFAWWVDGVLQTEQGSSFSGSFARGQTITCSVTPGDGTDTGTPRSASVGVLNSEPGPAEVTVVPSTPNAGEDDVVCLVAVGASEPDGDSVSYQFSWTVNGLAWGGAEQTTWPGDTVPVDAPLYGQTWTCTVLPDDGDLTGPPAQATVVIGPSAQDGTSRVRAAPSCGAVEANHPDPVNADYWIHPGGDFSLDPVLLPCVFDLHVVVFSYSGAPEEWVIPLEVGYLTAKLWGAGGGGSADGPNDGFPGSAAGYSEALLDVRGLDTLTVVVGRGGKEGGAGGKGEFTDPDDPETVGCGGQGAPGTAGPRPGAGAGGGFSGLFDGDVRQPHALVLAGGGGGAGLGGTGGGGGGLTGQSGPPCDADGWGGGGGSPHQGGWSDYAPCYVTNGPAIRWGAALFGGSGSWQCQNHGGGGGGGGGWFGGGGGGVSDGGTVGCGGGGGSGFVHATRAIWGFTDGAGPQAVPPNAGDADYPLGAGVAGVVANEGGHGAIVVRY